MPARLRPPKQDRSRRTLNLIVRAALELIAEKGVENTGVHDIVELAGSSVGSFYARFRGKEDLLVYLEERLWADAEEHWAEARDQVEWDELELEELVEAVVRILLEAYRTGARQRRVLEGRRGNPGANDLARRFHAALRADLRDLILRHRARVAHPEPELAVDLGLAVIVSAVRELEESAELDEALPELTDDLRVRELTRVYLGYLGSDRTGGSERVEFFEIWG